MCKNTTCCLHAHQLSMMEAPPWVAATKKMDLPLPPSSQSGNLLEVQQTSISTFLQLHMMGNMRLGTPFLHPVPTHKVEAPLLVHQAENTVVSISIAPFHKVERQVKKTRNNAFTQSWLTKLGCLQKKQASAPTISSGVVTQRFCPGERKANRRGNSKALPRGIAFIQDRV